MHDPKEVLAACERTIGQYDLTEVAKMLIEEGNWADTCRAAIIPFMECAETALPQFAQRLIELEAENAKLRAVAEAAQKLVKVEKVTNDIPIDVLQQALADAGYGWMFYNKPLTAAGYGGEE